jgi:hypothetical protein
MLHQDSEADSFTESFNNNLRNNDRTAAETTEYMFTSLGCFNFAVVSN